MRPNSTSPEDRLHVFLRDCKVDLNVGIYESEMHSPQPIIINVKMESALKFRYDNLDERNLNHVIDYAQLYKFIRDDLPTKGHIYLLESLAETIVSFCFRDLRVLTVHVKIEKPHAFSEALSAGIEIIRSRVEP